jgi:hypothetical protein
MTIRHLLPIALVGTIAAWSGVSAAPAQPAAKPPSERSVFTLRSFLAPRPARPPVKSAASKPSDPPPIAFFVATGPANTCGSGCDGWIAADGKIDLNAAQRLRKVLAKLGPRKLPLYLHSTGGSVLGAIELGRLIRSRNLTVSVARTIPAECPHDDAHDKACEALKRSGQDLVAELESSGAMCNSACVLVLAGGTQRSVPPWVRLGVHAIGVDTSKTTIRGPLLAAVTRSANARIMEFLHDMGIPKALFEASNAVPHESARFLQRDELVRFGLDVRQFGETDWRFAEKPYAAIAKGFFVHTGDANLAYPEALLRLNCGVGQSIRLTFARERPAPDASPRPLRLTMNGTPIDLPSATQSGKIEIRAATLLPSVLVAIDDKGAVEVSGFNAPGADSADGKSPDGKTSDPKKDTKTSDAKTSDTKTPDPRVPDRIVLAMTGFSAAYAKLRKVCGETANAFNGCSPGDLSPHCLPNTKTWGPAPSASGGQMASPAK